MIKTIRNIGYAGLMSSLALAADSKGSSVSELSDGFTAPEQKYKPRVWWHWMNATVTKDGVTKDLEAMQRVGIKGAQIFNMGAHRAEQNGDELILSPSWNAVVEHAAKECDRLGLKLGMSGGEGCSGSGGQWISPEYSMKELVWKELHVKGENTSPIQLPQPKINMDFYKEVTVLAYPSVKEDLTPLATYNPKVTTNIPNFDLSAAFDGNPETYAEIPAVPRDGTQYDLVIELDQSITVSSLVLQLFEEAERRQVKISTSEDGEKWRHGGQVMHLRGHTPHGYEEMIQGIHPRKAKYVKLEFVKTHHQKPSKLYELKLEPFRMADVHQKAARMRGGLTMSNPNTIPVPETQVIKPESILNLSSHLKEDGSLDYTFPAGDWTVLRFGYTTKGNLMKPAAPQSAGLEVDKMSVEAIEYHVKNGMLGMMAENLGDLTGDVFNCVNLDSWEAGCQTWTELFPSKFQNHHQYELNNWLVTVTGRVVGSVDQTERFLWDYRRTVADLIVEGYYATLRRLLNEKGIMLEAEAPGTGMPIIADGIKSLGVLDIVQGEFWLGGDPHPVHGGWKGGNDNTKEPAAAAHVYGKEIVSCEAFTSFGHHDGWTQIPSTLKPYADRQFCKGMNEIVFHCSAHQPDDRAPGQTLGQFGLNFHRHLTWWEQGKEWIDYLSRCQYMLRQGRFVADVLYFYGEDSPNSAYYYVPNALDPRKKMLPSLPVGYDYDVCDLTILMDMKVENGEVVLPSGMRYKYLVLPSSARYTPKALTQVLLLVKDGATVIGPKPHRSPSMNGYPEADKQIQALAAQIWPTENGPGERLVGKGKVITGKKFKEILAEDKLEQDFTFSSNQKDANFCYIHRTLDDGELYFVSNQKDSAEEVVLTFRVTGKAPQLWDPVTGEQTSLEMYQESGNTTSVALKFNSYDSKFILFQKDSSGAPGITDLLVNGERVRSIENPVGATTANAPILENGALVAFGNGTYDLLSPNGISRKITIDSIPTAENIDQNWKVTFPEGKGAPTGVTQFDKLVSWTDRPESGIQHFSGTATYSKQINLSSDRLGENQKVLLNLGQVDDLAEVIVNGKNIGILWQPPFIADITHAVKPGANQVEVQVTNVWKNRLIGDANLPEGDRTSFSNYPFYKGTEELLPSGLLGPVTVESAQHVNF